MRRSTILYALAAVLALGFASCGWAPQLSLSPLYTDKELVQDDMILGTWNPRHDPFLERTDKWVGDADEYTITKSGTAYTLTRDRGPSERPSIISELHLVRLGKYLFVDVATPRWSYSRDGAKPRLSYPSIRAHAIGRITVTRNVLIARMMETEKIKESAVSHKFPLKQAAAELERGESVLTSPTIELQKVALEHVNDRELFSQPFVLCRKGADCELEVPREEFSHDFRNANAGGRLAIAYMRRGRFNDAWRTWKRMPTLKPDTTAKEMGDPVHRLELACALIDWGYNDSAAAVLKAGVAAFPSNYGSWLDLAAGNLYANHPQAAMAAFKAADELRGAENDKALAHFGASMAYLQMGQFGRARYEAGQIKEKNSITAWVDFAEGKYEAVSAELLKGSETKGEDMLLRYRMNGKSALNKSDQQAIVIKWFGDYPFGSGSIPVKDLAGFLRGDVTDQSFLAQFHERKGQFVQPALAIGYYFAGEKYFIDGDLKKARDYFEKAVNAHAYGYLEWMVARARLGQLR